jgi:hypothetical protein
VTSGRGPDLKLQYLRKKSHWRAVLKTFEGYILSKYLFSYKI